MARPRPLGNISLATRLSLVALVVTLVSLTVTATVGLMRGSDLAGEVADDQLVSVSASRATAVEVALTAIRREVEALATSPATGESISALGDAVEELRAEPTDRARVDALTEFYLAEVIPDLELVRNTRIGPSFLVPTAPQAIYLQGAYTVPGDDAGDAEDAEGGTGTTIDPELVLDPGDGSTYSSLHPAVHQTYGRIGTISGFDDLFLVDARDNTIVYSFRKRIDFATSLDVGPHSGSALARLLGTIADDPTGGARLSDFAPYVPAGEAPTTFVASAVLDDGRLIGYIAGALSVEQFDAVLSGNDDWDGAGETGDVFLAGPDGIMRTTSRRYATEPAEFLAVATEPGPGELSDDQRRRISRTGTTALVQPIDRRIVDAAADGPGLVDSVDYQGVEVRTAYRPLAIDDVDWTIVSEIARDELDDPIERYARDMLLAMALFVVGVTFVAVRWSDRIVAPLRAIARRLRSVRTSGGPTPAGTVDVPEDGPREYRELADNVDDMLRRLADRQAAVDARNAERVGLLRQFLPANVARRSEESDGEVLDHVGNASVVVLTLDGVADLVGGEPDQQVRDLLAEIVDEVDALATDFGLERIKLTGATYYAVCGATRPLLDHAPRAVGFGLAARDIVDELGDGRLAVRGGVASGPVSVGLAARAALLYDVWGDTVARAEQLAASAPDGTILVSDTVRAQLPDEFVTAGEPTEGSAAVTARLTDEAAR